VIERDENALLEIAACEERSGHWSEALESYAAAYRRAAANRDAPMLREVILREAHCRRIAGESEVAREILEMLAHVAGSADDRSRVARACNGMGIIDQTAGDLASAERHYLEAREQATAAGDRRVLGQSEQNLGILFNIRGDLNAALKHYRAGLTSLREAGAERDCALALNNLGMVHVDLDLLREADDLFLEALEICERLGDIVTAGTVHINRTELYLKLGDTARARASCDEGFEIASRVENHAHRAEALKFYGAIYRTTGKLHLAEIHLLQAIEGVGGKEPLLEAETQREFSLVLRELGRNREALTALNRAHTLFSSLQAQADQADIHRRIGQLEEDFLSLVRFWGESIEAKDRYTGGHCARVADYACRIAEAVGFPEADLGWFRMGAYLHDIGKVEVSAEILNKPGRLTDEERALMERHTEPQPTGGGHARLARRDAGPADALLRPAPRCAQTQAARRRAVENFPISGMPSTLRELSHQQPSRALHRGARHREEGGGAGQRGAGPARPPHRGGDRAGGRRGDRGLAGRRSSCSTSSRRGAAPRAT
jgi:tetratricopeptide (TPR) repeat protein